MFAPNPYDERKEVMSLDEIRSVVQPIARSYGIDAMYLFGSVARGDFSEYSDYDFSIDQGKLRGFYDMIDFIDELANALGRDVDVLNRSDLGDRDFIDRMKSEEVLVYAA